MTIEVGNATVVLTGAAGGMGEATAAELVAVGWHVVGVDNSEHRLAELARRLGAGFTACCADVTHPSMLTQVQLCLTRTPPVKGLVNMVGVSRGAGLLDVLDDDWAFAFSVNVTPAMRLMRALAPQMQAQGEGSIVNVGSPVGVVGARKPQYAASKAALHGLTMSGARALGPDGVRVNLLLPGPTITRMTDDWSPAQRERVAQGTLLKRLCEPAEVAKVVAFLLGPDSRYITASVVDMTAGSMMGHA